MRQGRREAIDGQIDALRGRASAGAHELTQDHVYTDKGYAGSRLDRPGPGELRDATLRGDFDVVAVLSPDRSARKYAYQVPLPEEFRKAGCEIAFLHRPIADDPQDRLLLQIQGAVAEYERAVLAERFRRGKLLKARLGIWLVGKAPYGYRYAPKRDGVPGYPVVDEDEAAMVRSLFCRPVDERMTSRRIAKRLDAGPWRPPSGRRPWSPSVVHRILHDETYAARDRGRGGIGDPPCHPATLPAGGIGSRAIQRWIARMVCTQHLWALVEGRTWPIASQKPSAPSPIADEGPISRPRPLHSRASPLHDCSPSR